MAGTPSTPRRDLFGDVAVSKGLLTWAQVRDALKRQLKYKDMGIPIKIGEVCVELRILTQAQCSEILAEQSARRKASATPRVVSETTPIEEMTDDEPFQMGRYRLEKRLGGVMGIVYRGIDTETGNAIALKILPRSFAYEASFVERFKREVKATSALSHPNIVKTYDAGIEHGVFYLATEFIDGESLNQRLKREGALPEKECLRIALAVTSGLAHAHSRSVLHRDVKPENILLGKNGDVKLSDFGLAKILEDHQQITAEGIAVGTPHYIAPEQARALKDTDSRADLYALGATLFHVMTGRLPYEGDDGAEIMRRHVFEDTPDPLKIKPDMTPAIAAMLVKLMSKNPAQRYQSADELAAEIQRIAAAPAASPTPPAAEAAVRKTISLRKPFAD
ncbi:MAG TPA: serine/threonine-protein kinase [Planctomycetota bacterium]|jgi:serine/threonine protein kinase